MSPLEVTHINKRDTADAPIEAKTQKQSIKFDIELNFSERRYYFYEKSNMYISYKSR